MSALPEDAAHGCAVVRIPVDLAHSITAWRKAGQRIAFVPTMGALHEGHLSLVRYAQGIADKVIVSIFINPTQFAPHEDLETYPRTEDADLEKLEGAGVDLVYIPPVDAMYPDGDDSAVSTGESAKGLETDFRPHFFSGVVNVVSRLFKHVQPDIAVFGEKDFQQLCVIKEMTAALDLPIEIHGAPIIRDDHGLALSSRNAYLFADELTVARTLNKVLRRLARELKDSKSNHEVRTAMDDARKTLVKYGFDKVDYLERRWDRVLAAAWIGKTRLIDNVPI